GERDDPVAVLGQLAEVERRLAALKALEEPARAEADEVAVALVGRGEQRQVVALDATAGLGYGGMVVDEVDLAADDRLYPVGPRRREQLDRAVHDTVVGQPDRRLAELRGALDEGVDLARAVEQRVLG